MARGVNCYCRCGYFFIQVEQEVLRCVHLLSVECCGCYFYTGVARGAIAGVVYFYAGIARGVEVCVSVV